MKNLNLIVNRILNSIEQANNLNSKLNEEILSMPGLSSKRVRHFLNNLITDEDRYLEIGTWQGSTFVSALYKNKPLYHLAIDNWSKLHRESFFKNCSNFLDITPNVIENDCFQVDTTEIKDISIYFFDGEHTELDHYRAITYYYKCLSDIFILIVDDWNWEQVRTGTKNAIKDMNINILFEQELPAYFEGDTEHWWNGMYVALCKK